MTFSPDHAPAKSGMVPSLVGAPEPIVRQWALAQGDPALLEACFRLRYRYFVEQRAWVAPDAARLGIERDNYDEHALHLAVTEGDMVSAYLRVLPFQPNVGFMLDNELSCLLSEEARRNLPRKNAVELSRLVLHPDIVLDCSRGRVYPLELLLRNLYQQAKEQRFELFYIVVEEAWLRPFVRRFGLPFRVLGPPYVFPDGTRTVAAVATLEELEAGMRRYSPAKYVWYQEDG